MTAGNSSQTLAVAARPDGRAFEFISNSSGQWIPDLDIRDGLIELVSGSTRTGWKYYDEVAQQWETYAASGVLLSITRSDGNFYRMSYADGLGGITPIGAPACVLSVGVPPPSLPTPAGRLQCVTNSFGRQLNFQHEAAGRLSKLIDPAGGEILYTYDEPSSAVLSGQPLGNNLTSVTYQNGRKRSYHYNEHVYTASTNLPNALTGISHEMAAGQFVRYGIYNYDGQGRAISTEHAGGVDRHSVNYVIPYQQSIVTDPLGTQRTYNFSTILGVVKQSRVDQPAGAGSSACSDSLTYDAQGNVDSRSDFNGNKTCYAYDLSRNLETKRVEGLAASEACSTALSAPPVGSRVISTQWHPDWRLETRIAEPKKITTTIYNGQGDSCAPANALVDGRPIAVVCTRTEQATTDETGASGFSATTTGTARTWRYTYTTYGRVLTATDPNNRTTITSYHPDNDPDLGKRGNVASITNAANHITYITDYNAHGQPTRIVDPNGVVTVLTYDPRMRLANRTVGNEATVFGYDPMGQMTSVNLPDGAALTYTYDAAHRLTAINDHKGNRIDYTLDAMGNRITEQMKDPGGMLVGNIARVIDALNRTERITGTAQ